MGHWVSPVPADVETFHLIQSFVNKPIYKLLNQEREGEREIDKYLNIQQNTKESCR